MKRKLLIGFCMLLATLSAPSAAQALNFNGQYINWLTMNPAAPFQVQGGLRYLPELSFSHPAGQGRFSIDGEFSANIWGSLLYTSGDSLQADRNLSPYRAWIKFSGEQFELRAGLQKINFGSAMMLRPLMWFDRMDPRDPLQLTDGVYGLLGRYYFNNNANIWLWSLYGNEDTRGWELFPTAKHSVEFGGRAQIPLAGGELAFSYHHRTTDPSGYIPADILNGRLLPENRFALDGKFNLLVGLWFESTLSHIDIPQNNNDYTSMINLGADYTFNLGNGLNITTEFFRYMSGSKPYNSDASNLNFAGLSLNYPINIIHNISAILFYDPGNKVFYRFLNWGLAYDKWSFYVMGFWNPDTYTLYNFSNNTNLFGGWGFQLMAVFNH